MPDMASLVGTAPSIEGKAAYLDSPFVTAGDRVYMVGQQDGSFKEIGWHIKGEMGGIWDHPIKLMDGFDATLYKDGQAIALNHADSFVNFPFANLHRFMLASEQLKVERWQFVPDYKEGIAIQYRLTNTGDEASQLDFEFTGHADLRPTWLGEKSGMEDQEDQAAYLQEGGAWLVKDQSNPWYLVYGSDQPPISHSGADNSFAGKGVSNSLRYKLNIPAGASRVINFLIAGSYHSKDNALATFMALREQWPQALKDKRQRYAQLAVKSKLTIPDKHLEQTFEWLKYNCDWLVRSVPEIGTGIGAGLPDYPWWFGVDSEYALKGYMAVGQTQPVYKTIALLDSVSESVNGNGRILHEMSTNGVVFNKGNINETPQFASLIWDVYSWNGDREFLKKYFPTVKKGLSWLLTDNDSNHNLFPDGFGMMEIHGMDSEMIDVAAYTQKAFSDAAKMAGELGDPDLEKRYQQLADSLKRKINTAFWSEENESYADFLGTDKQALQLIQDAIVRADTLEKPWAVAELQETAAMIRKNPSGGLKPFVVHHNWVVNTPMEMQIADSSRAKLALNTAGKFVNPFGLFVTGIDRDESAGTDEGSFQGSKVFSYTGAVMTLPTGVLAVAENNYGHPDKALDYLQRISRSFSFALPGSIYEVSPDYGMMTQAWNIYAFAIPIIRQFFGIEPRAFDKTVIIKPQFPSGWEQASIENVAIGEDNVSVFLDSQDGKHLLRVTQSKPDWKVQVVMPEKQGITYRVTEGDLSVYSGNGEARFSGTGTAISLEWPE